MRKETVKFVVYTNLEEAIVTTPEKEADILEQYFGPENRDLDEYNREEITDDSVQILCGLRVR